MKHKQIIILFILFVYSFSLFAQLQKDSLKYTEYYYPNGKLSSEGFLRNGKPDRYWKTYNENGNIKSEGNRKNYELDSTWEFYDDSTRLILEINYKKGLKNGVKRTYFKNKQVLEENFVNDIKSGLSIEYYPDKKIHLTVPFVKGQEHGIAKEYDKEGNIITITEYKKGYVVTRQNINRRDKNGLKQGLWKTFYDEEGTLHTEITYRDDRKNGYYKEYSRDGNLLSIKKYIDDELQTNVAELTKYDTKPEFYPDGNLKKLSGYKEGKLEGMTTEYKPDGSIEGALVYKNGIVIGEGLVNPGGKLEGEWKEFYDDGKLKSEGHYKNNVKVGEWKYYFRNAQTEQLGDYDDKGRPKGNWKWFFENGKPERDETYRNGLENGYFKEYSDSGKVITEGEYVDGLQDGPWVYSYLDYKEEGKYNYGKKDGYWKHFYSNGSLRFEGNFVDGAANGKHIIYWDNGKVKEEGNYIMGLKDGEWQRYDEDGLLFLITYFKNGIEKSYNGVKIKPEPKE